jgi:hypothetical protein
MNEVKVTISLRVSHAHYTSNEISEKLGLSPLTAWSVGEKKMSPKGRYLGGFRENTYCTFRLVEDVCLIDDVLNQAVEDLVGFRSYFCDLVSSGGHVELFIGVFVDSMTGFSIKKKLLQSLSDCRIELAFDLYGN